MNRLNPVHTTSILILLQKMNTKKRVCYQVDLQQPVKKGVLNTKMYSSSPTYIENRVISVLKDMIKLKRHHRICDMYV
jgi:hypothetical protein